MWIQPSSYEKVTHRSHAHSYMPPPFDQFALSSLPLPSILAISSSGASSQLKQPVPLVEKEISETRNIL